MRCVQVLATGEQPGAVEHVRDAHGHLRATCQTDDAPMNTPMNAAWVLLRPDSYIAATGKSIDATLAQAAAAALGVSA